jgi:hypothetical protein
MEGSHLRIEAQAQKRDCPLLTTCRNYLAVACGLRFKLHHYWNVGKTRFRRRAERPALFYGGEQETPLLRFRRPLQDRSLGRSTQ